MYHYDEFDRQFVNERVAQFRGQVDRRLAGALNEAEFRPLRLMNGVYLELHGYLLRVAIPYGTLSAVQMEKLADVAETYDKGYGHFTTRQNIQFNWPQLKDVPDILAELASVDMHAIQTSGSCIRCVTSDPYAGVVPGEVADPRFTAELLRQWSSNHPEFSYLPRKFKMAVTGSKADRTAMKFHDIGLRVTENADGQRGYEVWAGGGLGRTPMIAILLRDFMPEADILRFIEAILRVYNAKGRRDDKYKARLKILIEEIGGDEFRRLVDEEFAGISQSGLPPVDEELQRIEAAFGKSQYENLPNACEAVTEAARVDANFARWLRTNTCQHKVPGYAVAIVSLKPKGGAPGDATASQMRALARVGEAYSLGEIRVSAEQNIFLPYVKKADLFALWQVLQSAGLANANAGLISDVVCCPGLDYCSLAPARSIRIAQAISERFADPALQEIIGPIRVNISGCLNACSHHHLGDIGILGLEKLGAEAYHITLGGDASDSAAIGARTGSALSDEGVVDAIERLIHFYLAQRQHGERFRDTYRRLGHEVMTKALSATQ